MIPSSLLNHVISAFLWLFLCQAFPAHSFQTQRSLHRNVVTRHTSITTAHATSATSTDQAFLNQAVASAKLGLGHTFPNPAVGCVLVNEQNQIIGQGFHPRAGFPHAEVFALLQASGHVSDGVRAAKCVIEQFNSSSDSARSTEFTRIQELTNQYRSDPSSLFQPLVDHASVTAYVTLEPCCHYGQTPPCALALQLAGVQRVVVGFRDPNPRVDGGGVQFLQQKGVTVDLMNDPACASLVAAFCQRITPRPAEWPSDTYNDQVTGAMRSALRSVAGRQKAAGTLPEVSWAKDMLVDSELWILQEQRVEDDTDKCIAMYKTIKIKPEWMEHLDQLLWDHELVQVRLNNAVNKKKDAKLVGQVIAAQLQAHVTQTVGHTCLLYRPGVPPVLNLEALVQETSSSSSST
ncbi:diaminohydroxyphosphoribosylaminopyrimidine deaminase / 5-amino-6-(5-phosphoribosylamino)uracil reductase [Fistulifera solaris]|uniref:Diaminohydroxyphosphoribosylaminopyrimidine deaminase / 5-amino-6-(5-phosphoribosylamino)uracil reductase n=1 Tax=Fistulifera solaris TaxID=1519565 RepID=A0A1Z5JL81_FISSO|nr:diaminohydroxyphosphoribosylaminopyrimidine deaminase / 5-amino-6-(5-phosphoribosylamino)uracil reductase [Fistulifera solaris]|eukprot:GAX14777.1 diaminohydroxyphosphoribosylaminopyrimidine deaminase / 5-amino-6-(5-phosphoribosylamino)uracil reductase [Fistulifera solaris]